jgi:hypothetical protein
MVYPLRLRLRRNSASRREVYRSASAVNFANRVLAPQYSGDTILIDRCDAPEPKSARA